MDRTGHSQKDFASEESQKPAGIYIHIPFCRQKCPYCDFYSITDLSLIDSFINAAQVEIELVEKSSLRFDTLYIGGGTPSVLSVNDIALIIRKIYQYFKITPDAEVSMEINPGTVTHGQLERYRDAGLNRINVGGQSFQDKNLQFLGRIHDAKDFSEVLQSARQAGFDNLGLDLIYGLPGQTKDGWVEDLKKAVEFEPDHLSCYMLTYESGTPMERARRNGQIAPLADETDDLRLKHDYASPRLAEIISLI